MKTFRLLLCLFSTISVTVEAVLNTTGYIVSTGNPALSFSASGYNQRFLWDPGNLHFQAGSSLPAKSATGAFSMSFGSSVTSSGQYSLAFGSSNSATATYSLAMGNSNTASGTGSIAMGYGNASSGNRTVTLGYNNSANGYGSGAFGRSSSVNVGSSSTAFALGYGLTVLQADAFVVGRFNSRASSSSGTAYRFVVGDGTGTSSRRDAFWIDSNGNVHARGKFYSDNGTTLVGGSSGGYSNIHENGSNIGIGTTSPARKLEVLGGASGTDTALMQLRSNGSGVGTGSTLRFANSTGATSNQGAAEMSALRMTSGGASDLLFRVSTGTSALSERMRITSGGNVGIGTTNPQAKLHVWGQVRASSLDITDLGQAAPLSLALGELARTYDSASIAAGMSSSASGSYTIAMGYDADASGYATIALGNGSSATGNGSVAMGRLSKVQNLASNATALALGHGITVAVPDAVVVGRNNDLGRTANDNVAFVVGIGQGTARDDGLVLDKQGNLWVAGAIRAQPSGDIPMGVFQ